MESEKKHKPKKEPEDLKDKLAETTSLLQRVQADFENYKKRVDEEKKEYALYVKAKLLQNLLSIIDTFEIALKNTESKEEFVKGIQLIYSQMLDLLKNEGVSPINTIDKHFDPRYHEALAQEERSGDEKDDCRILEELQKGYTIHGRVLRSAKVKILRCKSEQQPA